MFARITNVPRDYAWGSTTALATLLGHEPSGRPEAELWLGAHPGCPSRVLDPLHARGAHTLDEWIARDPAGTLGMAADAASPDAARHRGDGPTLPFLFKVLAAARPLSLQVHPDAVQARAGYDREQAAGIPAGAAERSYRDPYPKPELVYALSEHFEVLCGFRPAGESEALVDELIAVADAAGLDSGALTLLRQRLGSLDETVSWLLGGGPDVDALVTQVVAAAALAEGAAAGAVPEAVAPVRTESVAGLVTVPDGSENGGAVAEAGAIASATVGFLDSVYPNDPAIPLSLLMEHHSLRRGEALFLPPGTLHCYLGGVAAEVMAPSDNVLRAGLTDKHVDAAELRRVLDVDATAPALLEPEAPHPGVHVFGTGAGFRLLRVEVVPGAGAAVDVTGPAIALVLDGHVEFASASSRLRLRRGEAAFVTADVRSLSADGNGVALVAATE